MIEQLVQDMGKRWAEIARRLGNRSDNAVKNWWNGSMNRRKRSTGQHGSGSKGVGYRTQPIPASGSVSLQHHLFLHEQPPREIFSGPPPFHRLGLSSPNPLDQAHRYSAPPQYGEPARAQRHFLSTSTELPIPEPITLPRLHTWSENRSDFQLPPLANLQPSVSSPAATGISRSSSPQQAPSLISDDQSNCSISPKTVTSPRPGPPPANTPSLEVWPELQYRSNAGGYPDDEIEKTGIPLQGGTVFSGVSQHLSRPGHGVSRGDIESDRATSTQQKEHRITVSSLLD